MKTALEADPRSESARTIAQFAQQGTTLRAGAPGRQVAWHRFGAGAPVVLLHGGHGNWLHWLRNIEPLARHHSVWVPDLPGFGESDPVPAQTMEALLEALCLSMDEVLGVGRSFGLAGFSFGGLVAAHIAARTPEVSALALLGPAGHGGPRRPRGELRNWREALEPMDAQALSAVMRHNLLAQMLYASTAADDLAVHVHTQACLRTRFKSKPISLRGGLRPSLERYAGPLLLLWGEHDITATPEQLATGLVPGRSDCTAKILPGVGHWVQYEASHEVNPLLVQHLATR